MKSKFLSKYYKSDALSGEFSEMFYYISKAEENIKYAKYYLDNMKFYKDIQDIENAFKNIKNELDNIDYSIKNLYLLGTESESENEEEKNV